MSEENTISNIKVDGTTYAINDTSKADLEEINELIEITTENKSSIELANDKLDELLSKIEGSGIDTSDATATASQILLGKTAYVNGVKVIGTLDLSNLLPENLVSGVVINGVEGIHVCEIISPESPEITTYDINEVLKFKISTQSDFKNDDLKSYWEGYKDKIFTIYDNSESGTSRVWKCDDWPDTELYYSSFNDGIKRWIFMDMTLMGYTLNTQSTNPFDSNAQWEAFGHGDCDGPITLILEVIETQKTSN